mgnify:CR=1 FL=1
MEKIEYGRNVLHIRGSLYMKTLLSRKSGQVGL